jgi:hypothetical protein
MCAAVGTEIHQHGLEACTMYGNRTVCSCRHSKSSACTRCGAFGNMLKNDNAVKEFICSKLAFIYLYCFAYLYQSEIRRKDITYPHMLKIMMTPVRVTCNAI